MIFKSLYERYQVRYHIPYLDLADAGESNRIIVHFASLGLFIFSSFCMIFFAITLYPNYAQYRNRFIYYSVFLVSAFIL